MDWPQNFFFAVDNFGREWFLGVIFSKRNVILMMPVHGNEDLVKMGRFFERINGTKDLVRIGNSKGASLTEVVLGVNNDKRLGHD